MTMRAYLLNFLLLSFLSSACTIILNDDPEDLDNCEDDCNTGAYYYNSFSVETITLEDLQSQIDVLSPLPFEETGKLYFYDNSLFVNESKTGLHVLNVTDPSALEKNHFIHFPGNIDISIQDNSLYADLYSALVRLDISDLANNQIKVQEVKTGVFDYNPYQVAWEMIEAYEVDNNYYSQLEYEELNKIEGLGETVFISGVVYNGVECSCNYIYYDDRPFLEFATADVTTTSPPSGEVGQGGSLARFMIVDDYLYGLTHNAIKIFRINNDGSLSNWSSVSVDWGIETLYRLDNYLFIGATSGMFIYDLEDPGNPTFISEYEHFRACDPVVAEDNYAYVTLRSTNQWCANDINQLQIIDISNIFEPEQVGTYNMFAPYGLAVRGNTVWVCDSASGIKILDVSDKSNPQVLHFIEDHDARDIILRNNIAYVVTALGIVIYDVTNMEAPVELGLLQL